MTTTLLRYAVDITPDDVEALTGWLVDRLIHRPSVDVDTEEYRTNAALRYLVPAFAGTLSHCFGDEVVERAQTDPEARLRRIQQIQKTWNLLAQAAYPWRDSDGFDTERWHTVRFYDAEDEERLRQHEEKEKAAAAETTAFVSEYRIPGPRREGRNVGEFVVARDPDDPDRWAVFEGTAQARHWDGTSWRHARFTGTSPYLFGRATALALAQQHAERDAADEETSR
ncbi:hypothetical protein [Nonomuraea thailandensis]|uniref:hypothetical protein n=1 Tax=Nonomuraea thailandensis TaxID=1188745 RepID=UPI00361E870A